MLSFRNILYMRGITNILNHSQMLHILNVHLHLGHEANFGKSYSAMVHILNLNDFLLANHHFLLQPPLKLPQFSAQPGSLPGLPGLVRVSPHHKLGPPTVGVSSPSSSAPGEWSSEGPWCPRALRVGVDDLFSCGRKHVKDM